MPEFCFRSGRLTLTGHTVVMGILNVTPDSFSDGGRYFQPQQAADRARQMADEGAGMIDIGAQSTRPGHVPVSAGEEWRRLEPALRAVRAAVSLPLSVDTYYPEVARASMEIGADVINDVSGSEENDMAGVAAQTGAGLILMHAGGGADDDGRGENAAEAVRAYFLRAIKMAERAGLPLSRICLDPGIGFGKGRKGDLLLTARLPELLQGLPEVAVLFGASRKRVTAAFSTAEGGDPVPFDQRLGGTIAIHTAAQLGGAHILRVHDVAPAVQAARLIDALCKLKGEGV